MVVFDKTLIALQGDVGFRGLPGLPGPPGEGLQGKPVRLIFIPINLPDYSNESVILHDLNKHALGDCLCCCGDQGRQTVCSVLTDSALLLFQGNMGRPGPPGPNGPPGEGIQGPKVGSFNTAKIIIH